MKNELRLHWDDDHTLRRIQAAIQTAQQAVDEAGETMDENEKIRAIEAINNAKNNFEMALAFQIGGLRTDKRQHGRE